MVGLASDKTAGIVKLGAAIIGYLGIELTGGWIEGQVRNVMDAGQAIPGPTSLEAIRGMSDYVGWAFGIITLNPALAQAAGEGRSGFIAHLTLEEPRRVAQRLNVAGPS